MATKIGSYKTRVIRRIATGKKGRYLYAVVRRKQNNIVSRTLQGLKAKIDKLPKRR